METQTLPISPAAQRTTPPTSPLQTLHLELIQDIIRHLSPQDSLCFGLSCHKFYDAHFKSHKKVPLELNEQNIPPRSPQMQSAIENEQKTTQQRLLDSEQHSLLPKPLLAPPIHALFPPDGIFGQRWGIVRITEIVENGTLKIKRDVRMIANFYESKYSGMYAPFLEAMPRCGCFPLLA